MNGQQTEIQKIEGSLSARDIRARVNLIQEIMKNVMEEGVHFGTIPGCPKPSLFKAGAEKIAATFQIAIDSAVEDLSSFDEKRYRVTCTAYSSTGAKLGSAIGECSSSEEKYKWRKPVCDAEFEAVDSDRKREKWDRNGNKGKQVRTEPSDLANTILQMADKRAYVAVVRKATAASDIFTQDIEDLEVIPQEDIPAQPKAPISMPKPKAQTATPPAPNAPTSGDFKEMSAKFGGYCKGCNEPVVIGSQIYYSKTAGTFHKDCKENPRA